MFRPRSRVMRIGVVETLRSVSDGLRSGMSLRQALERSAGEPGSPLAPVTAAIAAGRPLAIALRETALHGTGGDADLRSALCVLAVHAEAGGDPLPAVGALVSHLSRRSAARDEARALTTQARMGAHTILGLTPAFLALLVVSDPKSAAQWLTDPRTRLALGGGLLLQIVGGLWIRTIVGSVATQSRAARIPMLRAIRALVAGRTRPTVDVEVADTAELVAFALEAGLAPSAAIRAVAPYAPGAFGDAMRAACTGVGRAMHDALSASTLGIDDDAARRFTAAYGSSVSLGVPLAPALRSLAEDMRGQSAVHLATDVRRASMRVLIPLGVVVLPAFVLACLVPLFVGGLQGLSG